MKKETILNVFPTQDDKNRLVMALEQKQHGSCLVLRQETYSDDVGWFVQSRVDVEPDQVAGLRACLTSNQVRLPTTTRRSNASDDHAPMILSFADASKVG